MVDSWRTVWRAPFDALFGIATLAAGGSEGAGWHMAGMRWSQTANYGVWPNPALPHSFGAQVYDLGEVLEASHSLPPASTIEPCTRPL